MAQIYPFRALRYDSGRVRMEDVVTQPYDKISPEMQQRYYELSPYNLIRIILGKPEPGDTDPQDFLPAGERAHNVYTRAAGYLTAWRKDGILAEEAEPALYGYSQTYTIPSFAADPPSPNLSSRPKAERSEDEVEGPASSSSINLLSRPERREVEGPASQTRERRGFIALGHLYDYADKVVYRHEQTFPKHKSDRLALFKATRAFCEQIYMLYSDPAFTAEKLIFGAGPDGQAHTAPDLTITDEYNVIHRVWRLTDPSLINLIVTAMADKKLIIADGHHRYETSVAYARERSAQLNLPFGHRSDENDESPSNLVDSDPRPQLPSPAFPEAAMMMTFVNMDAPGITILPTHRVVTGLPGTITGTLGEERGFSSADFLTRASALYTITNLRTPNTEATAASSPAVLTEAPPSPTVLSTGAPPSSAVLSTEAERSGEIPSLGQPTQLPPAGTPPALPTEPTAHTLLATLNRTPGHAFVVVTVDGNYLLTPKPEAVAPLLAQISPKQRQLEVAELHTVLLDHLLGLSPDKIKATGNIRYLRDPAEAMALVQTGTADLAFLIKPITLDQLKDISLSGDVMPQKSTDFYPKLLSGLAIYALD
jgi:uncharacterized protein (DUF1015 family)